MFDLTGIQVVEIGISLLALILLYVFRDHIVDLAEIVAGHKKLFIICIIVIFVAYFVLTYKPPPPPPIPPQYMPFTNNITQIGYKWPGNP
jgi:hypothetical protein